jgi:hypothetical protein
MRKEFTPFQILAIEDWSFRQMAEKAHSFLSVSLARDSLDLNSVVLDLFIGSQSQQVSGTISSGMHKPILRSLKWELIANEAGASFSLRNVRTRRYLGMRLGEKVKDGYTLREVEHAFQWDIRADVYEGSPEPSLYVHLVSQLFERTDNI